VLAAAESSIPRLTCVIPCQDEVLGVTTLGDEVFVWRARGKQISVYNAVTFTFQRRIVVPAGVGSTEFGMAACATNKCLYMSHKLASKVLRVKLKGSRRNAMKKWSVVPRACL